MIDLRMKYTDFGINVHNLFFMQIFSAKCIEHQQVTEHDLVSFSIVIHIYDARKR